MSMDRSVLLDSLKVFLGIDDNSQDAELSLLVEDAIQMCDEYLGRQLDLGSWLEEFPGLSDGIVVRNWPITELVSIEDSSGNPLDLDDVYWTPRRNVIRFVPKSGSRHTSSAWSCPAPIVVNYSAGYTGTDIPMWVKTCVNYIAAALYNLQGTGASVTTGSTGETKSMTIPGVYKVDYDTSDSTSGGAGDSAFGIIPEVAVQQLNFYRDKRFA